jgi:hypothetical protein
MSEEKFLFVRVVSETCYCFPVSDAVTTRDRERVDRLVDQWFRQYPLSRYHAGRDGHKVGGHEKLISTEVVDDPPWIEEASNET